MLCFIFFNRTEDVEYGGDRINRKKNKKKLKFPYLLLQCCINSAFYLKACNHMYEQIVLLHLMERSRFLGFFFFNSVYKQHHLCLLPKTNDSPEISIKAKNHVLLKEIQVP